MQKADDIIINVQEIEPRFRHQKIFEVFNQLKEGESLIIHNDHDPKPVQQQLMNLRGNIFSWHYILEGPRWWDVRVTRIVPMIPNEDNLLIINVPLFPPSQKHANIFNVFEHYKPGQSFIIHNDHDPKPLYYHFSNEYGDVFEWEYLQEGPQWWDVKITIKNVPPKEYEGELVIDVPSLEPQIKHATIFETYENLKAGESLIIHNDHDPRPVYFQLSHMHGDKVKWEYLQKGPQWWDVRVTKTA